MNNNKLFWFDEVEQSIIKIAYNDLHYFNEVDKATYTFAEPSDVLSDIFNVSLYKELESNLYEKLEKMSSFELNMYISNSFEQIKTHKPELRYSTLLQKFWEELFAPYEPKNEIDKFHIDFFKGYFVSYSKSFEKFSSLIIRVFNSYAKGLFNTTVQNTQPPVGIFKENPKLKTNLTVPQLAYLFRLLNDLNPNIFDIEDKTDLSDFIANNFITKATESKGISPQNIYNKFSNVEKVTAKFWAEKLQKMLQEARKV